MNSKLELQRVAGRLAFFQTGCYLIVIFGAAVSRSTGDPKALIGWPILLLPAGAFVPSVIDAVKLHRTTDEEGLSQLWWRRLLYAVSGTVLMVTAAIIVERITPV